MADEIGGYFARLRLIVDTEDFNKGVRSLSMMEMEIKQTSDRTAVAKNNWKDFVVGIAAALYIIKDAAAALKEMYGAMVDINKGTMKTSFQANTLGMAPNDLQKAYNAMGLFGVSKEASAAAVQDLGLKVGAIKSGNLDKDQTLAMSLLGIDPSKVWGKKPTDILGVVVDAGVAKARAAGGSTQDIENASSLVNRVLGGVGLTLTGGLLSSEANSRGLRTMHDVWNAGDRSTFTTNGGMSSGVTGALAQNRLDIDWKSIMQQLSGEMGGSLAPILDKISSFLEGNKAAIQQLIQAIASLVAAIAGLLTAFHINIEKVTAGAELSAIELRNFSNPNGMSASDKAKFFNDYAIYFGKPTLDTKLGALSGDKYAKLYLAMNQDLENNSGRATTYEHSLVGTPGFIALSAINGAISSEYSKEMQQQAIDKITNQLSSSDMFGRTIWSQQRLEVQRGELAQAGISGDVNITAYIQGYGADDSIKIKSAIKTLADQGNSRMKTQSAAQ